MKAFLFDTYALHEVVVGNPAYLACVQGARIVTTRLNLMELHYIILAKHGKDAASTAYDLFLPAIIELEHTLVKEANALRFDLKRRNVSYVDCIGYTLAQQLGIPFLTGDKEFKDLPNVKFVK